MPSLSNKVLVLNSDYQVHSFSTVKRVIGMLVRQKINIVKCIGNEPLHPSLSITGIPIVVALKNYIYVPYSENIPTRRKIFARDKYQCQYCEKQLNTKNATIDHVIAKSHIEYPGNTWMNLVTCCKKCNEKKGNKTLDRAGMNLIRPPFKPKHKFFYLSKEEWNDYMKDD